MEEGRKEGREEGRKTGRKEGRKEGRRMQENNDYEGDKGYGRHKGR